MGQYEWSGHTERALAALCLVISHYTNIYESLSGSRVRLEPLSFVFVPCFSLSLVLVESSRRLIHIYKGAGVLGNRRDF